MRTFLTRKRSAFVSLTAAIVLGALTPERATAQEKSQQQHHGKTVRGPFEVVISRRGNPAETPIALAGMLDLNVDGSGNFTGLLTRGKDHNGNSLPGVLFSGMSLKPDPTGAENYAVYGQITGRSVSILFDLGNAKYIIGSGVSKDDVMTSGSELTFAGGTAIGPQGGDSGDWGTFLSTSPSPSTVTTCTTVTIFGVQIYESCTTTTKSG